MHSLLLAAYSTLMWMLQPVLRAKLARRAKAEPAYAQHMAERFGYYTQAAQPSQGNPVVWVHAVSLGETRAAAILLAQLRSQLPGMRLLLTHSTATGRAEGAKLLKPGDVQAWLPWDTLGATQRFLQHFRPHIGILMETEIWPSLCAQAQSARVPLVLANARLNAQSLHAAQRVAWLARPAYASLAQVWAQTEADAQRLATIGAQHISVQGNLKYDIALDAAQVAQGLAWQQASHRPVIMLASSREGEEALFLQVISALQAVEPAQAAMLNIANKPNINDVQWLIVPRHPQRFDEVAALIGQAGFSIARRSNWGMTIDTKTDTDTDTGNAAEKGAALPATHGVAAAAAPAQVWLGDSLGEMALYYSLSHSALLGGSFAPLGGQNLIEAIAAGCPVVMGQHTFNFADAAATAQAQGAALRVVDMAQGVSTAVELVMSSAQLKTMQVAGEHWLSASRGAAQRTAQAVVSAMPAPPD